MIRISILSIMLSWISLAIYAQDNNLVLNWSFEKYKDCPQSYIPMDQSHFLIEGWTYPTFATPDYFNRCSSGIVDVPKNFAGESEPKTGNGYAGAILSGTSESYREYLQGELREPMKKGMKYCITYYYKLASYSQICVDQLSFLIPGEQILKGGDKAMGGKPQFNNKDGLFLDNIEEWKQFCEVYTAKGGEKYFVVGNFMNYDNTNYVITDKNIRNLRDKAYAYYYFDDFVIRLLMNCKDCPCVQHNFKAAIIDTFYTGGFDPASGKTEKIINDGRVKLSLMGGTKPYHVKWSNGATGLSLNNLPAGKYTYEATDKFNCRSTGTVTFVEPELTDDEFEEGLKNIEEGEAIVLENIFFESNKTTLLDESHASLDDIIVFLKENNLKLIEISGHTDSEGAEKYNQKLSEGRAQSVVDYLVENGIDANRLIAKGYGEERPIETNMTDKGMAKNRRVEFRLLKK